MESDLLRLIRDQYPFPIAYAHKKMLGRLDNDAEKLKYLTDAAETVVHFLALVMLAQLAHDLQHQQAPPLGEVTGRLRDALRKPAFGTWQEILREVLKSTAITSTSW